MDAATAAAAAAAAAVASNTTVYHSSLMSPCPSIADSKRNRADSFPVAEIELMLKEMKNRSEIILSLSPSSHRLKKSAWEEVTAIMGIYFPKRSPEQVKKKWENLLTKTRRKVRQGLINTSSWSKLNEMVWNFLLENRETKYLFGPGRFSRADELSNLLGFNIVSSSPMSVNVPTESWTTMQSIEHPIPCTETDKNQQNGKNKKYDHSMINSKVNEMKSENCDVMGTSVSNIGGIVLPPTGPGGVTSGIVSTAATVVTAGGHVISSGAAAAAAAAVGTSGCATNTNYTHMLPQLAQWPHLPKHVQNELLDMWRQEHTIRMKILMLQHQAATVQHELMKVQLDNNRQHLVTMGGTVSGGNSNGAPNSAGGGNPTLINR